MKQDPTRTNSVRQAWLRQLRKRFRELNGRVNRLFSQGRAPLDPEFTEFFQGWITQQSNQLLGGDWQDKYVEQAYAKGILLSAIPSGLDKIHTDAIKELQIQSRNDVNAALAVMVAQSTDRVSRGTLAGISKRDMANQVKDRVDKIGRTRSLLVANTMTPYSSNVAEVNAAVITGEDVKMRWITQGDERVRTTHALRNGKLYSPKAALNLLGEPNCRCRVEPMVKGEDEKEYEKIREAGLDVSIQAQREQEFWRTLAKERQATGFFGG